MVTPMAVRDVAAIAGGLLVIAGVTSVVSTVIVPRASASRVMKLVDKVVNGAFHLLTQPTGVGR